MNFRLFQSNHYLPTIIRASVDALYRDGAGQISRDPGTKRYQTRRECLPRASKTNRRSLTGQYLAIHFPKSIVLASNTRRENRLIHDFTIRVIFFFIIFFIIFFFCFIKPAISILERVDALIFSLKVSRVGGGVHG